MMPLPLLAESAPTFTAAELYAVAGVLVFIGAAVVLGRKVFGHEPPLHKEYVTKAEHDKYVTETKAELARHASSRKGIYDRLDGHGLEITAIKKETEGQTKDLSDLKKQIVETNSRIDAVPMRTIQLLRETQQLHHNQK